ncbi:MAG: hypothetical protein ACTJLL_01565, partial [Anaplasma sp.]
ESDPRSGGKADYAATTPANVSHKICGTGHGTANDATASTNCRSGARGSNGGGVLTNGDSCSSSEGCGISSADSATHDKALQGTEYDTLVTAFDANDAVTDNTTKKCSVKAGSAFDGTPNVSHKICGTGEGENYTVTTRTNCRSGVPAATSSVTSGAQLGLGIGSVDLLNGDATGQRDKGKALTAQQWDTLVKAFEAENASTADGSKTAACTSGSNQNCKSAIKAGSAFDGAPNSHKICGTGEGTHSDVTHKTNCRSGAPATKGNGDKLGLGIGSVDVTNASEKSNGKALQETEYDTLVKAFEADNASTAHTSHQGNCAIKAGSAFDGAPNSHKIKPDVAGTMANAIEWLQARGKQKYQIIPSKYRI